MNQLPLSITVVLLLLTIFLSFITALKYIIRSNFVRTRLIMSAFFFFIVLTLTISFWPYTQATLPYTIPAVIVGLILGHFFGVRAAKEKLQIQGVKYYMEHFAHVHFSDIRSLNWWSIINFYSVMGGLVLINFVGLSTVIFQGRESWAILTSVFGAFLIGTIVPYLWHLWRLRAKAN